MFIPNGGGTVLPLGRVGINVGLLLFVVVLLFMSFSLLRIELGGGGDVDGEDDDDATGDVGEVDRMPSGRPARGAIGGVVGGLGGVVVRRWSRKRQFRKHLAAYSSDIVPILVAEDGKDSSDSSPDIVGSESLVCSPLWGPPVVGSKMRRAEPVPITFHTNGLFCVFFASSLSFST